MNMENKQFTVFSDIEYVRPDFDKIRTLCEDLTARVAQAKSYAEVKQCILEQEEF